MPRKLIVEQQKPDVEKLNAANRCMACGAHDVATFPVHLTQLDGSVVLICHVARCMNCGYVKNYGMYKGIFKLNGIKPDFKMQYWKELQENGITPDDFIYAVSKSAEKQGQVLRTIWLDARNGLKQYMPTGKYADFARKWEQLTHAKPIF